MTSPIVVISINLRLLTMRKWSQHSIKHYLIIEKKRNWTIQFPIKIFDREWNKKYKAIHCIYKFDWFIVCDDLHVRVNEMKQKANTHMTHLSLLYTNHMVNNYVSFCCCKRIDTKQMAKKNNYWKWSSSIRNKII